MTPVRLDRTSWAATARPARIVHIGVGSFSRAHQAWYTARADPAGEWGIVAFTGRNPAVAAVLSRQDGLYTLIERGPRADRLEVIDSICDTRPGSDVDGLITVITAPQTALVTLTVTEAGYVLGAAGDALPSVPMRLALALASRRHAGAGPLAIVSCDNVHANGTKLRELTLAAADEIALFADMHDLPPCLITVGTLDPLLDDSLFLHARLRATGNPVALHVVDEAIDGFNLFPIAAAREAAGRINAFLGIPHSPSSTRP